MAKQALYAHPCADRAADGVDLRRTANMTPYHYTLGLICGTRDYLYLGYGSDTGQRLATKSQGRQCGQIIDRADLAGCNPLQRQSAILRGHPTPVTLDLRETSPGV